MNKKMDVNLLNDSSNKQRHGRKRRRGNGREHSEDFRAMISWYAGGGAARATVGGQPRFQSLPLGKNTASVIPKFSRQGNRRRTHYTSLTNSLV